MFNGHPEGLLHVAVTEYPTSEWVGHQFLEAFPWDSAPRYLLRDRMEATARSSRKPRGGSVSEKF